MDLSLEDASKMFSGATLAAHPLDEIRAKLADIHAGNPTRSALAQMAMDEIKAGLDRLAALGHAFHLSPSSGDSPLAFPQMLYKDGQPEMTVESQVELDAALADGWQEHPTIRKPVPAAPVEVVHHDPDSTSDLDSDQSASSGLNGEPVVDPPIQIDDSPAPASDPQPAEGDLNHGS